MNVNQPIHDQGTRESTIEEIFETEQGIGIIWSNGWIAIDPARPKRNFERQEDC
jgi:hypothetical protein